MLILRNILLLLLLSLSASGTVYSVDMATTTAKQPSVIIQLQINGVIGPATTDYIERNLQKAFDSQAIAVLINMDTPGGLDASMRSIVKKIISSPIPVITYVSPGGARAASAGTYILYASHIAAMAPATNLGAATPVQIGGFANFGDDKDDSDQKQDKDQPLSNPMKHKIVNDASAYIRGLAKIHGRNEQWAEQAVREAASLSAKEALELNVIDMVANDTTELLKQLQGRKITILGKNITFNSIHSEIQIIQPDWRSQFLATITNPSVAYILLMIGIYGLVFEFSNPGSIVPGTIAGICLLLALYALQLLPVNYAGMGLIILGVALMIAEALSPSFGILGFGGVSAFVLGSIILIDTELPGFGIDLGLIAGFAVSSAAFFIIILGLIINSRHQPVVSGKEQILGCIGIVEDDFTGSGMIRVHSESWRASCLQPLHKNDKVRITAIDGLVLTVLPFNKQEDA